MARILHKWLGNQTLTALLMLTADLLYKDGVHEDFLSTVYAINREIKKA